MAIDNIREWSYSFAIPLWFVYESTGFHLGNIGLTYLRWLLIVRGVREGRMFREMSLNWEVLVKEFHMRNIGISPNQVERRTYD